MSITKLYTGISNFIVELPNDPINHVRHFFAMSYWQSILAFVFVVITIASLVFIYKKWGRQKATFAAFGIGIIGAITFGLMYQFTNTLLNELGYNWVSEAELWLKLISQIFLGLIALVIPFYIFTSIIKVINYKGGASMKGKTYGLSFVMMSVMIIIGITVAFVLFPLVKVINNNINYMPAIEPFSGDHGTEETIISIPEMIVGWVPYSLTIFSSTTYIVAVIVLAIIFGGIIKFTKKTNPEASNKLYNFFDHFSTLINVFFRWVMVLIPFVIATRLSMIGLGVNWNYWKGSLGIVAVYFLGIAILAVIMFAITYFAMQGNNRLKRYRKNIAPLWLNSFINHNVPATVPVTTQTSTNLGNCEEVSIFNTTLGSTMGMAACGGFFPTLITLFAMDATGLATPALLAFAFITIFLISFGSTGQASTDIVVLFTSLSILGFSHEQVDTIITIAILLITFIEPFNVMIDTTGHVTVATVAERYHSKNKHLINPIDSLPKL